MNVTTGFFQWWFAQWGIGGWIVFFLLVIAAMAWLIYDSQTRRIPAIGWLMGAILPGLLLLPSAFVGMSPDAAARLGSSLELFFYLGLIGGIVPVVVAVGYFITYKDTKGCGQGHIYDASLPECPVCAQAQQPRIALAGAAPIQSPPLRVREEAPAPPPPSASRPKAHAWLVDAGRGGRTYQLNQGDTRIGRRKDNDIVFADSSVSREHVLIREDRNHFTLYDRGAKSGTLLNGQRVEKPVLLDHDDEIVIGDTHLRFVTSR